MKKGFIDQLNLRPNERRIVIVVGVVVFIVLNAWFVWPHFNDASKSLTRISKGRLDWTNHFEMIQKDTRRGGFRDQIHQLMQEQGSDLEGQSKEIQLTRKVQEKAPQYGVTVLNYRDIQTTSGGKTNEFFEERSLSISVQSAESNLVNFLYDMGNDPSMIRVRELHLKPADQNRYRLNGDVLLSANFQKKASTPAPTPTSKAPARAAATPVGKPTMNSSGAQKKSPSPPKL
jgi:Tfp pilus assembly protein PilO